MAVGASQLSIQQAALWDVALRGADAQAAEKLCLLTVKGRREFACSLALGVITITETWSWKSIRNDKAEDIQAE